MGTVVLNPRETMPSKLTQALVESLTPDGHDRIIFDRGLPGFAIRITPIGTKLFLMQARIGGRKQRVTIGRYPDLTVVQARELALQALADMRRGINPRIKPTAEMTIAQLADKWMADYVRPKLKARTVYDYERLLAQHILPTLGQLSVTGITRDDIVRLHVSMARIPRRANYVVSTIRALINFGIDLGLRPPATNPAKRIKLYRENQRERFLTEDEIGKAAEAIATVERGGKISPHGAAGLRLALFTGARSGEITAIQWSHIDWQRRLVRLPDSKTNEPRTIHLSEAALEVLKTVPRVGKFVIAGAKPNECYKNLKRAWIVARECAGLQDCRLHDLRHSYASLAAGRGVSLQVIGKLLGHRVPQTTARYAHLARDAVAAVNDELGAAMQAAIARGQPPSAKVVKLKRRPRR
jgi:integrase